MRILRRALHFVVPLLLLSAQQAALAHVVSHIDPGQSPAHERSLAHLKLCGKCVSAEELTHIAAGTPPPAITGSASYSQPVVSGYACIAQALPPYSSRAPPSCL
jgi:hypothetical protein